MKAIKNMRELTLMKQKLKYQEMLYEKEIVASTADLIDHMTDKFRDIAFDVGARLMLKLLSSPKKHQAQQEEE